jgi:hypothetical protein
MLGPCGETILVAPNQPGSPGESGQGSAARLGTQRPGVYAWLLVFVVLATLFYDLRWNGIFACQAADYSEDRYLNYCQATGYGDYDHGAFWFDLEPEAVRAAQSADVLVIGNSRTELALSTPATAAWFTSRSVSYYLLGFSHNVSVAFEEPMLQRLTPRARAYIVNVDRLFRRTPSPPARSVLEDSTARGRYVAKRRLQPVHRWICQGLPSLCRDEHAFFRSRSTGTWRVAGSARRDMPASYVSGFADPDSIGAYIATARQFVEGLPVPKSCVILTQVPFVETDTMTADTLAAALGLRLVAPRPAGLNTFDESHLDAPSAERWSEEFYKEAGPLIESCLTSGGTGR